MFAVNYTLLFWAELHVSSGLAAVLQATHSNFRHDVRPLDAAG